MWLLKLILFVALLVLLVFVGLSNDAPVDVHILGWHFLGVRVFIIMFASAMVGLLFGLAFTGIREVQWRVRTSRQGREQAQLWQEVQDLRTAPLRSGSEDPIAPPPREDL